MQAKGSRGPVVWPLTLTRVPQPTIPEAPRLRPALAWQRSPLAALGVVVSGLTTAAFRMVGPVYGVEVGLMADQIALFLAAFVLGGALSQYPAGWLADRYDRRWVLIWLSVAGVGASALTVGLSGAGTGAVMFAAGVFGFMTFPIYSVSAAHAHDFASNDERVELSAALMFLYAVGAIASPYVTSVLIDGFGTAAMFVFVSVAHVGLIVCGLARMRARPATRATSRRPATGSEKRGRPPILLRGARSVRIGAARIAAAPWVTYPQDRGKRGARAGS